MLSAHRTETTDKGMAGISIAPNSRFPWAKGVAGPHGVLLVTGLWINSGVQDKKRNFKKACYLEADMQNKP